MLVTIIQIKENFFSVGERYVNRRRIKVPVPTSNIYLVGSNFSNCLMLLEQDKYAKIGLISHQEKDLKLVNRTGKLEKQLEFDGLIFPYEDFSDINTEITLTSTKNINSLKHEYFPVKFQKNGHTYLLLHVKKTPELALECLDNSFKKYL